MITDTKQRCTNKILTDSSTHSISNLSERPVYIKTHSERPVYIKTHSERSVYLKTQWEISLFKTHSKRPVYLKTHSESKTHSERLVYLKTQQWDSQVPLLTDTCFPMSSQSCGSWDHTYIYISLSDPTTPGISLEGKIASTCDICELI